MALQHLTRATGVGRRVVVVARVVPVEMLTGLAGVGRRVIVMTQLVLVDVLVRRAVVVRVTRVGVGVSVLKPGGGCAFPFALVVAFSDIACLALVMVSVTRVVGMFSAGAWRTCSVDASGGNPLLTAGAARLMPTTVNRPQPTAVHTLLLRRERRRRNPAPVVVIEHLTGRTSVIVVTINLVEVRHSVRVLTNAGGALLRRRSPAPVVVIEHLTRRTRMVVVTINLVQVRHSVRVLTNAGGALLGLRSSALVMVIEHLTRRTRVISMTRLMTIKMLTRRTHVISVTGLMAMDMVTLSAVVIRVARVMAAEMLTRCTVVIGVARVMTIKMLARCTCVVGVAVDLVVEQSVPVLTSTGGALHRRGPALVVVIEHLTTRTRVISVTSIVAVEMLACRTCVVGVASGVGVLSAGTWRAGSVDASRGNPLLTAGTVRLMPASIDRPCPTTVRAPFLRCR